MAQGEVPIRESIGAAFRFARDNARFVAVVSALGALGTGAVSAIAMASPTLGFVTALVSSFVTTFAYTAFLIAALFSAADVRGRLMSDTIRVWATMLIIAFFLFIVMFVASIVLAIVLTAGPLAPYLDDLQRAGSDSGAIMSVFTRFAEENAGALLGVMLFYGIVWFLLTSRLYLAAPATVDQQRILTFETWSWTKGAMLRITGARLLLLVPANIFAGALGHLVGRAFGINSLDPVAAASVAASNPAGYLIYIAATAFLSFALFSALEAGLSTYLYRGLKPTDAPLPAPPAA